MNEYEHSTIFKIDLDNVVHNYETVKKYVFPSEVIPVIKGNAYGHGAIPLARTLVEIGCRRLAVGKVCEAAELRNAGIGSELVDIIIMSGMLPYEIDKAVELDASFFVHDWKTLNYVKSIGSSGRLPRFHIKVDTGMGRFGFMPEEGQMVGEAVRSMRCKVEGVGTHLAAADEEEHSLRQLERLDAFLDGMKPPQDLLIHIASSSAVASFPSMFRSAMFRSAVRVGDLIYGFSSVEEPPFKLYPVLSCITTVTQVKRLPPGWHIGYGVDRWIKTPITTAVVAMGATDGLMSSQAGRADMLIHGARCKILAVCADAAILDVSSVNGVEPGDIAVYIGSQGGSVITVPEQARAAGTGHSELLSKASLRTPRLYYRHGKCVGEMSFQRTLGCSSPNVNLG